MANYIECEFRKYLEKVCSESMIQDFIMDFYNDLVKRYKGVFFERDDFETLNIDGVEVEQDVVKELFAKKDKVKAEEILLYLFKNNIDKVNFYNEEDNPIKGSNGFINNNEKILGITNRKVENFYIEPIPAKTFSLEDYGLNKKLTKEKKQEIKEVVLKYKKESETEYENAKIKRYRSIKHTVYHEMSHIFEIKSFENRKFFKNKSSDVLLIKDAKNKYKYTFTQDILTDQIIEILKREDKLGYKDYLWTVEDFITSYKITGSSQISEIMNEIYACETENILKFEQVFNNFNNNIYIQKSKMAGTIAYNVNYDVALFIKLAIKNVNDKQFRFNSKKVIKEINALTISKSKFDMAKTEFINFLMRFTKTDSEKYMTRKIGESLMDFDIYSTICFMMGVYNNYSAFITDEMLENNFKNKIKVIIQKILIETIKNKIIEELNDPCIEKDEQYFKNLNDTLISMDSFLWYPNNNVTFYKLSDVLGEPTEIKDKEINLLSIENITKFHKKHSHIATFNELILEIKKEIKNKQLKNIKKIMTFLQTQEQLDKNWKDIVLENQLAKNELSVKKKMERYENEHVDQLNNQKGL